MRAERVGTIQMRLISNVVLKLKNVYFIPKARNLLSVGRLRAKGIEISLTKGSMTLHEGPVSWLKLRRLMHFTLFMQRLTKAV